MHKTIKATIASAIALSAALLPTSASAKETIVFVRHGEKPVAGLGQLSCRGLNRAIALPAVLVHKFGSPEQIFAANPADRKADKGVPFDYVRPLATIEPTAILLGMPVDTRFGVSSLEGLQNALLDKTLQDATIYVAWEHHQITVVAKNVLQENGGNPTDVPSWDDDDFDSVYVVTVDRSDATPHATLKIEHEGLDNLPDSCPGMDG